MSGEKSPSAVVVPFGKHKGATVEELLVKDPQYANWMLAQGWVAERFAELHAAILCRGAASEDSPEHNAIQVRFLDEAFRTACLIAAHPTAIADLKAKRFQLDLYDAGMGLRWKQDLLKRKKEIISGYTASKDPYSAKRFSAAKADIPVLSEEISVLERQIETLSPGSYMVGSSVKFEQRGIDVVVEWHVAIAGMEDSRREGDTGLPLFIEIKPTMGDDFPSVMRQMQRLRAKILVLEEYTGRAVSEPQVRKMFEANGMIVLSVRDIEAEIPNARQELAS